MRPEIADEVAQQRLWTFSEQQIAVLEKDDAIRRASAKKAETAAQAKGDTDKVLYTEQHPNARKPQSRRSRKAA